MMLFVSFNQKLTRNHITWCIKYMVVCTYDSYQLLTVPTPAFLVKILRSSVQTEIVYE